ncbi:alanine--glyoxylate aminotransferase family protein [Ruegeria sp. EL01]|jgi:alanine-glyoxylate transaminase/serine-glyoxylate transaminase/serine-pyruvate transaminase|uniref:pyridoxal-phosphate-dependent aminotransferase family protein n=1 Tax=Ruegeria sp. EL01 TaxID=2107578 RepID=UPI000EA82015|nr:aminotransferase class V-fold PLP-dependent enzyme [Ruegeria sp. EL01]
MSLSFGREYLAIPGPSVIPDKVRQAMHQPSPNIYEGPFAETIHSVKMDLKTIAGTSGDVALYATNGHGVWDAALGNIAARDEKVLVLATGQFALHWAELAKSQGVNVQILDFGNRATIDTHKVRSSLKGDKGHKIKAVLAPHVDTATSIRNDIAALRCVLDELGHPAILCADIIASLGCDLVELDEWGVDVAVAACQKGLMTPAGIGVLFFNKKADEARGALGQVNAHWDWRTRAMSDQIYPSFFGTPPTQQVFGLRAALDMLLFDEGLDMALRRHEVLAKAVWAAIDMWSHPDGLRMTAADPTTRSHAVTSVEAVNGGGIRLQRWVKEHLGLTLGRGLGMAGIADPECENFFRIGHMGHVNGHMILGVIGAIDAGLKALDIPHESGALTAATSLIADFTNSRVLAST